MKKLKVTVDKAVALYQSVDAAGKTVIENLFEDHVNIFKINTDPYLKACDLLGVTPVPPMEDRSNLDKVSSDAYDRLIILIRVKNMMPDGSLWKPVYDGSERHYFPYFKPDPSGFGLSGDGYDGWGARTGVGSRLEYRTRELALEGGEEFKSYYNDFLTQ